MNRKCQPTRNSFVYDCVLSSLLLHNKLLRIRSFATTVSRKGDPLGFMVAAFSHSYTPSLINNPLAGAFIILMGMAATLFFLVTSSPVGSVEDPSYAFILQRLDYILLLCERFVLEEQSGIDRLLTNLNNFAPDILYRIYLSLQEHVLARESLFSSFSILVDLPIIEFLPGPLVDRIHQNFEDFRLGGNNLMALIRSIEIRLDIPELDRIPSFWFEE